MAALIAAVTFAAGFTMPSGYISEKGPAQGLAILTNNSAFKAFLINTTIADTRHKTVINLLSSYSVLAHLFASLCRHKILINLLFWTQFGCIGLAMLAMGLESVVRVLEEREEVRDYFRRQGNTKNMMMFFQKNG